MSFELEARDPMPMNVADGVHQMSRVEHEEPSLVDEDARTGDTFEHYALFGKRSPKCDASGRAGTLS
ncbi:MAG TPA: hypothetical protein VGO53_02165 [Steroidobacteraceae bacterium]|nr:hypothetical protein [Steroidobacteraceae bacterium]